MQPVVKWRKIYQVLFPGNNDWQTIFPYLETEDYTKFENRCLRDDYISAHGQEFLESRLNAIRDEYLRQRDTSTMSSGQAVNGFGTAIHPARPSSTYEPVILVGDRASHPDYPMNEHGDSGFFSESLKEQCDAQPRTEASNASLSLETAVHTDNDLLWEHMSLPPMSPGTEAWFDQLSLVTDSSFVYGQPETDNIPQVLSQESLHLPDHQELDGGAG